MLAELELGPTAATSASPDQLALRKEMVQQLVIEESRHEAVEEMYFWPAVRERVEDGTDLANQAQEQEQEGKVVLGQLDKLEADHEQFEARLAEAHQRGRCPHRLRGDHRLAEPAGRAHRRGGGHPRVPA